MSLEALKQALAAERAMAYAQQSPEDYEEMIAVTDAIISTLVLAPPKLPIHLFAPGSIISSCCNTATIDERIRHDQATYQPEVATCQGGKQ